MKQRGFTKIDNNLLECIVSAGLNATEFAVLFVLIRYTSGYQKIDCRMPYSRIAKVINKSERGVKYAIDGLRKKGFVSRKSGKLTANSYIVIPRGAENCTSVDKIRPQ